MAKKVVLVVPEAPAPAAEAVIDERRIEKKGIRLGVLERAARRPLSSRSGAA
jgi:hypothetical protein